MPTSNKPLGLANDPTIGENLDEMVVSNRVAGFDYFESLRDSIARGSLFAALFSVAGPREGKARGYLTESVDISGAGNTFSLSSNDGARYDGEAYIGGLCPWRAASGNLLEQRASIFNVEHTDATLKSIPFSNTAAQSYYIGICCATYPTVAEQIPRIGSFQYTQEKTIIGYKVKPLTVTDLGGGQIKLDLNVDAMVGTHSLAGRTAIVYLKSAPEATTATAIASGTMTFSSPTNSVTVGYLGQTTPSTNADDYAIVVVGPVCTNDVAILNTDGYAHAGTIVGSTHVVNTDSQDVIPTMLGFMRDVITVSRPSTNTARQNAFKLQVKAKAGEAGVKQIEVLDSGSIPVFNVDETGAITGLSLTMSGALAVAAITCTTLTASGLITANGGIIMGTGDNIDLNGNELLNCNKVGFGASGPHVTHAGGSNIIVQFNEAANRSLTVENINAGGYGALEAGELRAVSTAGGTSKVIAGIHERGVQYDSRHRFSALAKFSQWIASASGGGALTYNGGGATPPFTYVSGSPSGVQTFYEVLNLRTGDQIVSVGCLAYRANVTAAIDVVLRTWPMSANAVGTAQISHSHTGATGAFNETITTPGAPVTFAGGANDRYVLEIVLTNDGAAIDTARIAFAFIVVRRAQGADLCIEIPLGG